MKMAKASTSVILALLSNGIVAFAATAQSVVNVSPRPDAAADPSAVITGGLQSTNSVSIPVSSVKIFLDGKDVTAQSGINSTSFSYRPQTPLSEGEHTARVEFAGSDGVSRFVTWTFNVPESTQLVLNSVAHNATNGLNRGSVFQVNLKGSPNQTGSVLLIRSDEGGQAMQEVPAREVSSGEYIASFTVGSAELQEGIVIGRLTDESNTVAYAIAKDPARFNQSTAAVDPETQVVAEPSTPQEEEIALKPEFTSHKTGDRITSRNGFLLKGKTQPDATVQIKVNSASGGIGGFLGSLVGGTVLVDQSVRADAQGNFEVNVPRPLVVQRGTRYTVEATADNNDQSSQPVVIELIQE
ncbi:MAG: hypothetical protein AAGB01_05170 [Cyanobacteria bacterium P01_F01_bin.42]